MSSPLSSIGEFTLIRRLKKILMTKPLPAGWVGIGDDASILPLNSGQNLLLTHDLLLEGVHFLKTRDFRDIGWKALAVNLSDIAAMGGRPLQAVVGLGLPSSASVQDVESLYRGLHEAAKKYHCPILGGDTNKSRKGWIVSVTVLGICYGHPLRRAGAKFGDSLWVTGQLGGAALAWEAWKRGKSLGKLDPFRRRLLRPEPRLDWGELLFTSGLVTSAIDISDGLAGDLCHLRDASATGFLVDTDELPRAMGFETVCRRVGLKPLDLLLGGGEDYELLFTVRAGKEKKFAAWAKKKGISVSKIGQAVKGKKLTFLQNGRPLRKTYKGFSHF